MSAISITPRAGFCIKSKVLDEGLKVFVNICWHDSIPAPQEEEEPLLILSEGRKDVDKKGASALVFDAILNTSVKSRILRSPDQEYKLEIVEQVLKEIEAHTGLRLSRMIATPNIASKGKLGERNITLPALANSKLRMEKNKEEARKPLIEEVSQPVPKKSILKPSKPVDLVSGGTTSKIRILDWNWKKLDDGSLSIDIHVPPLTHDQITASTLFLEPRRLILSLDGTTQTLDINLNKSDAEIVASLASSPDKGYLATGPEGGNKDDGDQVQRTLFLKRQRVFDVDNARSEWRVKEGKLLVFA